MDTVARCRPASCRQAIVQLLPRAGRRLLVFVVTIGAHLLLRRIVARNRLFIRRTIVEHALITFEHELVPRRRLLRCQAILGLDLLALKCSLKLAQLIDA
jgi:hypothetical protein